MDLVRLLAVGYFLMFVGVAALDYIPGVNDARGYLFRLFGILYFLDGVMGLFLGSGYLDFGIIIYGVVDLPLIIRFLANLPHLVIGGFAIFVGFWLSRRRDMVPA